MSTEIYTGFGVHTANPSPSAAHASPQSLFDDQEDAVVVLGQSYSSNTHPAEPTWNITFLGKVGDFNDQFLPAMAYLFRDGLARSYTVANGAAFRRHMFSLYACASPLDAVSLWRYGFLAYSWSSEDYNHITDHSHAVRVEQFGSCRYGSRIQDDSDAQRLVKEALEVKAAHHQQGQKSLWSGRPWSLCSTLIHLSQR